MSPRRSVARSAAAWFETPPRSDDMKNLKALGASRRLPLILLGIVLVAPTSSASAQERLSRVFTMEDGLPAADVLDVAQTHDRFLWITSSAGLVRFDGDEMRRWGETVHDAMLNYVRVGPANQLVTGLSEKVAYDVVPGGLKLITGPDGERRSRFSFCNYDRQGYLWCIVERSLLERDPDNCWHSMEPESYDSETPYDIFPLPKSGMVLCTREGGLWRIDGSGSAQEVLHAPFPIVHALALDEEDIVYVEEIEGPPYEVIVNRWTKGQVTELFRNNDRVRDIEERTGRIWISFINRVVVIPPHEEREGPSVVEGFDSGTGMAVDHEGSLWIGTFTGLVQLPEPDTLTWNVHHGLPSSFFRSIVGTDEGVWAASWHGLVRAAREGGQPRVRSFNTAFTSRICADNMGGVWAAQPNERSAFRLWRIRTGSLSSYKPVPVDRRFEFSCSLAEDGRLWMTADRAILRVEPHDTTLQTATVLDDSLPIPMGILADRTGRLWVHGWNETVCAGSAEDLIQTGKTAWSCEDVGRGGEVRQLAETPTGEIWAATLTAGVLERTEEGWIPLLMSEELGAPWVQRLQRSRWGGMWVSGAGFAKRFDQVDGRWSIVEAPTSWHGTPLSVTRGVYEDAGDNLWVASVKGVTFIPARVRRLRLPPPHIYLADARVEGQEVPESEPIRLRENSDLIELRFSALSYREPGRLRYRIRWNEGEWTETTTPVIHAAGLRSGTYRIEAVATIDGKNWSEPPAAVSFFVPKPWYLSGWTIGIVGLMVGVAAYTVHRVRLVYLVRLEQQRARIAMDLHDELGSGLATINVLAAVAAEDHRLPRAKRVAITRQISESATVLGRSLTDLVWSLRPDSPTLDALIAYLLERSSQLFAEDEPQLRVCLPDAIPPEPLSLPVRRNVQLIALEGLNNAKKHAQADDVEIGLAPDGQGWRLWVYDDGLGNRSKSSAGSSAFGLLSMRQRAGEIGAELDWTQDEAGTRLTLRFSPRGVKLKRQRRKRSFGYTP